MLNTDIHSDKATAPCQGAVKYWFACTRWHKETAELYNISPSFQLCYTRTQILNVCIWCGFFFFSSHSLKTSLQCDSRNRVENYFGPVPTFSLSPVPVIRLSSIVSLWLIHITREWCRSFVPDPFYRSGSFFFFFFLRNQLFIFLNPPLIHILPFTDLPRPGWP